MRTRFFRSILAASMAVVFSFFLGSCDKSDDTTYKVDIEIVSPATGVSWTANLPIPIQVKYERADNQTIHHVKVLVLNNLGATVATLDSGHKHVDGEYSFSGSYTPTAAGTYTLSASSTDDAEKQENKLERQFTVR